MAIHSSASRAASVVGRLHGLAWFGVAIALSCSGSPTVPLWVGAPTADVVSPPVGVADRSDDPAVVAIDVGDGLPCAGALVAPDVVLTALHCVALRTALVACGAPDAGFGAFVLRPAGSLRIFVGDDLATAAMRAQSRQLVIPPDARLCGADLALVLLDRPIDDVQPLVVRTTGAARGDHVRTVGFGTTGNAVTKRLRDHVAVLDTATTELELAETTLGEGGGPALDETTAEIVGVVSRDSTEPSRDVYTRADAFAAVIAGALAASESAPASRVGTLKAKRGPADMGANCQSGSDCAAGVCVLAASGTQQYCSRGCGAHDRCPTLFACQRSQGRSAGAADDAGETVCVRR